MKNVKFVGNLKKDIEMSNMKFNLAKIIITKIINCTAAFLLAIGITYGFLNYPISVLPILIIVAACLDTVIGAIDIKKQSKKFKSDKQKAQEQLIGLVYSLQRVNVCTNLNQLQNSKVQENKITSIIKDKDSKVKKTEISRDIYFLDNLDNLQVLREKRSTIIANGITKQDNSLKLIEEHEKAELELNVEKTLILKRKV